MPRDSAYLRIGLYSVALLAASCAAPRDHRQSLSAGPIKVNVCTSAVSGTQIVSLYALDKGMFARYGLDVTVVPVSGGPRAVAALISGGVRICEIAGPAVVHAVVSGADVTLVGGLMDGYVYSLMASASIRSPSDLKGKAIAISEAGGASETAARVALRTLGLQPDRDVAVLAIGGQQERLASLEAGYVAGTLVSFPETILARERGLHVLLDMSTLDLPTLHTSIATTRAFLKSDRTTVLNFMKAIGEATFSIKHDKGGTTALLARYLQLDPEKDAETLSETYESLYHHKLREVPYPSLAGAEAVLVEIAQQNPAAARFRAGQIADTTVVHELEAGGFFKKMVERP